MNKYKKLILTEADTKPPKTLDAHVNAIFEADSDMKEILERDISDEEKIKEYNQRLRSSLIHYNKYVKEPIGEKVPDLIEAQINEILPPSLKNKGELMITHLKNSSVQWTKEGELIFNGEPIKGSNIVSLVNDVLRKSKTRIPPQGWEQFAQLLRNSNIPQEFLANKTRYAVKREEMDLSDDEDMVEDSRPEWLIKQYEDKHLNPYDI